VSAGETNVGGHGGDAGVAPEKIDTMIDLMNSLNQQFGNGLPSSLFSSDFIHSIINMNSRDFTDRRRINRRYSFARLSRTENEHTPLNLLLTWQKLHEWRMCL